MQNATLQDESSSVQTTGYQLISALIALHSQYVGGEIDQTNSHHGNLYSMKSRHYDIMHTYSMQQAIDQLLKSIFQQQTY